MKAIFYSYDVSNRGGLDLPETNFALQSLGFYPIEKEIKEAVKTLRVAFPLDLSHFEKVAKFRKRGRLPAMSW